MEILLEVVVELQLSLQSENEEFREEFLSVNENFTYQTKHLPSSLREALISLWKDPAIKEAYKLGTKYQLQDTAGRY